MLLYNLTSLFNKKIIFISMYGINTYLNPLLTTKRLDFIAKV